MAKGHVGPREISGAGLSDPEVAALVQRVTVEEARRHSARFPAQRCADVTLTLRDGTRLESGDVDARGGPEAPLSEEEVQAKLRLFAEPVIGSDRTEDLWRMRHDLLRPGHRFADLCEILVVA
jgi:2-methylcitrate dehydratase PrpD